MTANVAAFGTKQGVGKTGVHFRYHPPAEFGALRLDQKAELIQWCLDTGTKAKPPKGGGDGQPDAKRQCCKAAREKALAAGCNDYETKPIEFKQLMSKIEKFAA